MNATLEPREWKLAEINWLNASEVKRGDLVRIDDRSLLEVIGFLEDLKGSTSGKLIGRGFLLDFGLVFGERHARKVLYIIEGHEPAIAWEQ